MPETNGEGSEGAGAARGSLRDAGIAAGLVLLVLAVFWDVGAFRFVHIDDGTYVYENPWVRRGLTAEGVAWAFTAIHASNWHPLTWLSHMLDVEIHGLAPGGHHWTSVLVHAANALLLFAFLRITTGAAWRAALVAGLFAAHPLHVESVAWVAERKDVLSTFFWFSALVAWARYARAPSAGRYAVVAGAFFFGLLSKPMVVTLPVTLLLVDVWPLRRWVPGRDRVAAAWPLIREKLPLFALSAISAAVTLFAQSRGGAVVGLEQVPLGVRVGNAALSYGTYLVQTIWPVDLSPFYPHAAAPAGALPAPAVGAAAIALAGLAWIAMAQLRPRPWVMAGLAWYAITLLPVIGLVQVGAQAHADRYTYVPLVGVFIALAWSVPEAWGPTRLRATAAAFAAATLALAAVAHAQASHWRDTDALFERALALDPQNAVALVNLGTARMDEGDLDAAIERFEAALRVSPSNALAHANLAVAYLRRADARALPHAVRAAELAPDLAAAHNALGLALEGAGRYQEAIHEYEAAAERAPWSARLRTNLGSALFKAGRASEAVRELETAIALDPQLAEAHHNLGIAYGAAGRFRDASRHMMRAAELRRGRTGPRAAPQP